VPKGSFFAIPKSDGSGGVEDVHVVVGARVTGAHPTLVGVSPFKPRPTEPKGRSVFSQVKNSKPSKFFGWQTISQFTLHLAPVVVFFTTQIKALSTLFMELKVPRATSREVK
jgi:hypothetical protein